jgi:hypothetical protein
MKSMTTIQDHPHYKLKVHHTKPIRPKDLNTITFVRETYAEDGTFQKSSNEQYNLTDAELKTLIDALVYIRDL